MTYRFLSPAITELAEAADFYEKSASGLGADFIDEADAAVVRILEHPKAWGMISEHYRH